MVYLMTKLRAKEGEDFGEGFFREDEDDFGAGGDGFGHDDSLLRVAPEWEICFMD
jgi:hypothetical protein